jgi:hypothetical protein
MCTHRSPLVVYIVFLSSVQMSVVRKRRRWLGLLGRLQFPAVSEINVVAWCALQADDS